MQMYKHMTHGIKKSKFLKLVCLRDDWLSLNTTRLLELVEMLILIVP